MIGIKRYPVILTQFHEVKYENLVDDIFQLLELARQIDIVEISLLFLRVNFSNLYEEIKGYPTYLYCFDL